MKNEVHVKHSGIDPTAIGLFGLAIVTLVASSQKLGWTESVSGESVSGVISWAVILGGIGQIIAAFYDAKVKTFLVQLPFSDMVFSGLRLLSVG